MAFSFVQSAVNAGASGTSLVVTLGAPSTTNSLLVINLKLQGAAATGISITDNAAIPNTYAVGGSLNANSFINRQWYGVQVTGGATTVTISWTTSTANRAVIDEFTGGAITNAAVFDKTAANSGTGTSGSVVSLTPTAVNELIVAGFMLTSGGTFTAGTDYTIAQQGTNLSTEYRLAGTTLETAPGSWTGSVGWTEIAGAYNPLGAAPPPAVINNGGGNSRTANLSLGNIARL